MKRLLAVIIVFVIHCTALGQFKIDLRTPMADKEKLKLAKAGLGGYLHQAEWAEIVNIGEEYSVFIKDLKRRFRGNVLYFSVNLEIRTNTDLGSGTLLAKRTLQDSVDLQGIANATTFEEREIVLNVEAQLRKNEKYKPLPLVLGTATGVPLAGPILEKGLKFIGVDLEASFTPDQALEAMVLGAVLVSNLKEMFDELRPEGK